MVLGRFEWAPWARNQALGAHFMILTGGVISLWYPNKILAVLNIALPIILMALEYPLVPSLKNLGFVFNSVYLRTFLHFLALAPTVFQAPTFTGGMCLFCCALTYLRAGINGESLQSKARKK
jgi:hypothetical protein